MPTESLFSKIEALQSSAPAMLEARQISLRNSDELKESYIDVLDALDEIATSPETSETQINQFTKKTIKFLELVHGLKPEMLNNPQDNEQLNIIKDYARKCADIYINTKLDKEPEVRDALQQKSLSAKTFGEAKRDLKLNKRALDENRHKHQVKREKYNAVKTIAFLSGVLIVTLPIVVPLGLVFRSKEKKQVRKLQVNKEQLQELHPLQGAFQRIKMSLKHIDYSNSRLSLSSEDKAEKIRTLKDSVHAVRQALGADIGYKNQVKKRQ